MSKSRARKKENRFVVFGDRELNRAVEMGYKIDTLFYREGCDEEIIEVQSEDVFELSTALFDRVSMRSGSEDVIAVLETKSHHINDIFVNNDSRILVLEAPEKPGNIGAILRSCDAANVDLVILTNEKCDIYNPNVIRSSVGTFFSNKIVSMENESALNFLKNNSLYYNFLE